MKNTYPMAATQVPKVNIWNEFVAEHNYLSQAPVNVNPAPIII
jgi:hypothetical protein